MAGLRQPIRKENLLKEMQIRAADIEQDWDKQKLPIGVVDECGVLRGYDEHKEAEQEACEDLAKAVHHQIHERHSRLVIRSRVFVEETPCCLS